MPFDWNDTWSVGVETCDRDHRKLFSLLNDLEESMRARKGAEVIHLVVDQLNDYARLHFRNEEVLMSRANYPDLSAHRAEHERFAREFAVIRKDLQDGQIGHAVTVFNFLNDWLQNHIRKSDKAYSDHLNACGIR